eukprot:scaffold1698_cov192-Ochromonas_danica.AAC.2
MNMTTYPPPPAPPPAASTTTSMPQFICCTATIANPKELVCRLLPLQAFTSWQESKEEQVEEEEEEQVEEEEEEQEEEEDLLKRYNLLVITAEEDGAPRGERTILLWNPPLKRDCSQQDLYPTPATTTTEEEEEVMKTIIEDNNADKEEVQNNNNYPNSSRRTAGGRAGGGGGGEGNPRRSPIFETALLLSYFMIKQQRTIAFCKVRKLVELVYRYTANLLTQRQQRYHNTAEDLRSNLTTADLRSNLTTADLQSNLTTADLRSNLTTAGSTIDLLSNLTAYRGGYSKEERREIESNLFHNRFLAIVATSALEVGINIGELTLTLHLGFPGTFSSFWQQVGRAGRLLQPSLHIFIAFPASLDVFFLNYPDQLLGSLAEPVVVDPDNPYIMKAHLPLAAKEVPLDSRYHLWVDHLVGGGGGGGGGGVHRRKRKKVLRCIGDEEIWGPAYRHCVEDLISQQALMVMRSTTTPSSSSSSSSCPWVGQCNCQTSQAQQRPLLR